MFLVKHEMTGSHLFYTEIAATQKVSYMHIVNIYEMKTNQYFIFTN